MQTVQVENPTRTLKRLTEEQIEKYSRDGFYFPLRAMPESEAAAYRKKLEDYEAAHEPIMKTAVRNKPHLVFTWINELIRDPGILDVVEDVLGPNILAWGTNFFIKEPHDDAFISWHQDSTYWGLSHPDVVTAWIALSDVTPENGAMRMLPGSHLLDQLPHVDTYAENNLLTRGQEVDIEINEEETIKVPLSPGQVSFHHGKLLHASAPNRSDERRIGFAINYIAPHMRQMVAEKDFAVLVRGKDRFGHFEHVPAPAADMDDEAVAWHRHILAAQNGALYEGVAQGPG